MCMCKKKIFKGDCVSSLAQVLLMPLSDLRNHVGNLAAIYSSLNRPHSRQSRIERRHLHLLREEVKEGAVGREQVHDDRVVHEVVFFVSVVLVGFAEVNTIRARRRRHLIPRARQVAEVAAIGKGTEECA